jgi:hypothetical protein
MYVGGCLLRYDITTRTPVAGLAYEVQPNQKTAASAFMTGLVGTSNFAGELGANFSDLLSAKYQLVPGGKVRRVFWINPGVKWAASNVVSRFTLSQNVVLVALIHLVTKAGNSRRTLLTTQASSSGSPSAPGASTTAVEYGTSMREIMADALGLPIDHVGWWRITMALTPDQACAADLGIAMRKTFIGYMDKAASAVEDVGIQSLALSAGAASCSGDRQTRRSGQQGGSTGVFDTIVAFKTGANPPALSVAILLKMPMVLAVEAMIVPAAIGGDQDSTLSVAQNMPAAAIWIPISVVAVGLAALLARQLLLRSDPQAASAKAGEPDDTASGRCMPFQHKQQGWLSKASNPGITAQKPRNSLDSVEISVMLGFMVGDNDLRRSLDLVRHLSSKVETDNSEVVDGTPAEETVQTKPAVSKALKCKKVKGRAQRAVFNPVEDQEESVQADLQPAFLNTAPAKEASIIETTGLVHPPSVVPTIYIEDAAQPKAHAAKPKRSRQA